MLPPAARIALGVLLILAGTGAFITVLVTGINRTFSHLERMEVPGSRVLALDPGDYTVYWEVDTWSFLKRRPPTVDVKIVSKDGATSLDVQNQGLLKTRYSFGGKSGAATASFSATKRDDYNVVVHAPAGQTLPAGRVAIGPAMTFLHLLTLILSCMAILVAGLLPGILLIIKAVKGSGTGRP
ncbi:MAG TPA: hypothetical protein VE981_01540 [Planctomycetota bacterium]|nr:hypothetical protein [Planctomycetota bacterium]